MNPEASGTLRLVPQSTLRVIVDFGLRHQHGELAFQRHELLIAEEIPRAQAGAVDHDRLAKGHEVARRLELPDHEAAAPEQEITNQRIEVNRRLDSHGGRADRVFRGKRMLARLQDFPPGIEPGVQAGAIAAPFLRRPQLVGQRVVVQP